MSKDEQPSALPMADVGASPPGLSSEDRALLARALGPMYPQMRVYSQIGVSRYIESLPPTIKKRVVALQEIQKQHDEYEAKFFEERSALVAKYEQLYDPLYSKRNEIVNGIVDVDSPISEGLETTTASEEKNTEEKGIPEFWLTAMKKNDVLSDEITKRDERPLKYLKDIRSFNLEGEKGFKLEFHFGENPYFKNTSLTKVYHMAEEDDPILERATGTEIDWYAGKNVTQKLLQKKPKKGSKNAKLVTKVEECESFFNFFDPPKVPEDDEDLDEETAERLQDLMEQDYDIGSTIKDKIIGHAVSWFTGEALQGDEFEEAEEDEVEDNDEDEDEEEDDEDEDEDDDDEEDKASNKRPGPKAKERPVQPKREQPPECKHQ